MKNAALDVLFAKRYRSAELGADEFWALREVSFSVHSGQSFGILGENGAGKSTLIRLISGIYPPNEGRITINGRIGALIALGAGFHPHMTGRENIYLNGSLMGMSQSELKKKEKAIIDFAELNSFIDSPVNTYSSGMTVRLGFAIASHCDIELLIADEILAVGDLAFALKCYNKMASFREQGGTTVLVSHNMQLIRNICDTVLWLEHGRSRGVGSAKELCDQYEKESLIRVGSKLESIGSILNYDPATKIGNVRVVGASANRPGLIHAGETVRIEIPIEAKRPIDNPLVTISIRNSDGQIVISNYNHFDGFPIESIRSNCVVTCELPKAPLRSGLYDLSVTLHEKNIERVLDWHERKYQFTVCEQGPTFYGMFNPHPAWKVLSL